LHCPLAATDYLIALCEGLHPQRLLRRQRCSNASPLLLFFLRFYDFARVHSIYFGSIEVSCVAQAFRTRLFVAPSTRLDHEKDWARCHFWTKRVLCLCQSGPHDLKVGLSRGSTAVFRASALVVLVRRIVGPDHMPAATNGTLLFWVFQRRTSAFFYRLHSTPQSPPPPLHLLLHKSSFGPPPAVGVLARCCVTSFFFSFLILFYLFAPSSQHSISVSLQLRHLRSFPHLHTHAHAHSLVPLSGFFSAPAPETPRNA